LEAFSQPDGYTAKGMISHYTVEGIMPTYAA
jgi:hypothetical protein